MSNDRSAISPEAIRREVARQIGADIPDVARDANALGTSTRTVQRTLHAAGLSFREVLHGCQYEQAAKFLTCTDLTIEEVGRRIGYSDPSNFSRAFRSWSGAAPRNWGRDQR